VAGALVGGRALGVAYLAVRVLVADGALPAAVGRELEAALVDREAESESGDPGVALSATPGESSAEPPTGPAAVAAWLRTEDAVAAGARGSP
jgi:hypothetical protein